MDIQAVNSANLSNVECANYQNSKPLVSFKANTSADTFESSNKEEKTKKNIGKYIVLGLGAAAAIGLTAFAIIKGKNKNKVTDVVKEGADAVKDAAKEAVSDFEKGVKKFFKNGKLVEGAKLEKGIAKNADGSMFSGAVKTMTKSGKEVTLEYVDGYITKSTINKDTYKIFDNISVNGKTLPRSEGVQITKCGKDNNQFVHFFHKNGKIKRTYNANKHEGLEFSEAGKKISEFKLLLDGGLTGKVFDENGEKLIKEFSVENGCKSVKYYASDGKTPIKQVFGQGYNTIGSSSFHPIADGSLKNVEVRPNEVRYYSNGVKTKALYATHDKLNLALGNTEYSVDFPKGVPTLEKSENTANRIRFTLSKEGDLAKRFQTACADGFIQHNNPKFQFTQGEWQDYMKNITEALNTAKAEGMSCDADKILEFLKKYQPTF